MALAPPTDETALPALVDDDLQPAPTPPDRPDRPDWSISDTWQDVAVRRYKASFSLPAVDDLVHRQQVAWVTAAEDLRAYLDEYGDTRWPVPETYKELQPAAQRSDTTDRYPRYCSEAVGTLYRYGYGIDAARVEHALRVLTGGGQFTADDYTLVACGDRPFVLGGPEGVIMLTPGLISRPHRAAQQAASTVAAAGTQLTVEEDDPEVLEGIERLLAVVDAYFPFDVASYEGLHGGQYSRHRFAMSTGTEFSLEASTLATLGGLATAAADVPVYEGGEVAGPGQRPDGWHSLEWAGPDEDQPMTGPVGTRRRGGGVVVGYQFGWDRQSSRRFQGVVETYSLQFVERDVGFNEGRLSSVQTRLGTIQP